MQRQVQPKKEEKGPLMQIKLGGTAKSSGGGGGFKKGGFKNAFGPVEDEEKGEVKNEDEGSSTSNPKHDMDDRDSDATDDEDYYDPRKPTGCMPGCKSQVTAGV